MPEELSIDREHSAVLIMDYQTTIVAGYGTDQAALLRRAGDVLKATREAKLPVIYVVVGFRPGYPEVSPRNATFSSIKQAGRLAPGESGSEIHSSVAPQTGDFDCRETSNRRFLRDRSRNDSESEGCRHAHPIRNRDERSRAVDGEIRRGFGLPPFRGERLLLRSGS
jgi:hypothetical protein